MDCAVAREHVVGPESCHHVQTIGLQSGVANWNYCLMSSGPFDIHTITVDPEESLLLKRIERIGLKWAARCPYHDHRRSGTLFFTKGHTNVYGHKEGKQIPSASDRGFIACEVRGGPCRRFVQVGKLCLALYSAA